MKSFKPTRESYLPKSYRYVVKDKRSDALVYVMEGCWAKAFSGKRAKPDFYYRFGTEAALAEYVAKYFAGVVASRAARAARAAAQKRRAELVVGDVLRSMWGYEQTNVEFWEVVAVPSACYVEVRELAQSSLETGFMAGRCSPVPGEYVGPALRRRVRGDAVRIDECRRAYRLAPVAEVANAKVYGSSSWTAYA
jgi:hypothetical protein